MTRCVAVDGNIFPHTGSPTDYHVNMLKTIAELPAFISFAKNEQANLTMRERNTLASLVGTLITTALERNL